MHRDTAVMITLISYISSCHGYRNRPLLLTSLHLFIIFLHSSSKLDCRMSQKCQNLKKVQRNIIDLSKYFCVISGFPADRKCRQNADTPPPLPDAPDPGHVLAQPRSIPSGAERNQRKKMASNAEIVFSTFIPPTSPPPPTEARIPKSLSLIANVRTKGRKQRAADSMRDVVFSGA